MAFNLSMNEELMLAHPYASLDDLNQRILECTATPHVMSEGINLEGEEICLNYFRQALEEFVDATALEKQQQANNAIAAVLFYGFSNNASSAFRKYGGIVLRECIDQLDDEDEKKAHLKYGCKYLD